MLNIWSYMHRCKLSLFLKKHVWGFAKNVHFSARVPLKATQHDQHRQYPSTCNGHWSLGFCGSNPAQSYAKFGLVVHRLFRLTSASWTPWYPFHNPCASDLFTSHKKWSFEWLGHGTLGKFDSAQFFSKARFPGKPDPIFLNAQFLGEPRFMGDVAVVNEFPKQQLSPFREMEDGDGLRARYSSGWSRRNGWTHYVVLSQLLIIIIESLQIFKYK